MYSSYLQNFHTLLLSLPNPKQPPEQLLSQSRPSVPCSSHCTPIFFRAPHQIQETLVQRAPGEVLVDFDRAGIRGLGCSCRGDQRGANFVGHAHQLGEEDWAWRIEAIWGEGIEGPLDRDGIVGGNEESDVREGCGQGGGGSWGKGGGVLFLDEGLGNIIVGAVGLCFGVPE